MLSLYIDSADRGEVTRLLGTGLFAGVTTNPAILSRSALGGSDVPDVVEWSLAAGARSVFVQAWGRSVEELVARGREFRALSPQVVVKVPASATGIAAARILSEHGPVLVTALHAATQIVPVIASGATYAAPFLARMHADPTQAIAEILRMQAVINGTGSDLQLLAGSVRTPAQVLALAMGGVRHVTGGPAVWDAFFTDDRTATAVENFERLSATATG